MLQKQLSREQVTNLGEQLLNYMEDHIIEAGYQYFSKGMIFNIHVIDGNLITSDVQGNRVYHVEIDLDVFINSNCTCPYSRFCKHLAATYFQIYSVFDNPKHYLQLVQQPRTIQFSSAMLYPVPIRPTKAQMKKQAESPEEPVLTDRSRVADWWRYFESISFPIVSGEGQRNYPLEWRNCYQNVMSITHGWKEVLQHLFFVHAILYHLQKLDEYIYRENQPFSCNWFRGLSQTIHMFTEQLEGTLYYLDTALLRAEHLEYLEESLVLVKELKTKHQEAIDWNYVYRMLWWFLLDHPSWVDAEVAEIKQTVSDSESLSGSKETDGLLAHFEAMRGQDEAALQVWHGSHEISLSYYLFYLKSLSTRQEWHRLLIWHDWLEGLLQTSQGEEYRLATGIWRHAYDQSGKLKEWGQILKRLLPVSYYEYATYLFDQKQYRAWLDLQMSYGVAYTQINPVYLKEVEETDPLLSLSFYVREVNRLINERTRQSYKEAIKLLKKIQSSYTSTNQEVRWEQLISHLSTTHNRLRAFQEELRRGNLIS